MTYSINEVAEKFGISAHTIRFYEKEGVLPFVSRSKSGHRVFTEGDLTLFKLICCLKDTGMQIKNIKKYIDMCMSGTSTISSRKTMLSEHRETIIRQMEILKENLDLINSKIEIYESPDAVEIVSEMLAHAAEEKNKNKLI